MYCFYSRSRLSSSVYTAMQVKLRSEIAYYAHLVLSETLIRFLKVWCTDLDKDLVISWSNHKHSEPLENCLHA